MKRLIPTASIVVLCLAASLKSFAQPGSTIELKKPPKYENRELRSEKTGDKRLTFSRRVYQDMVTHYNYYFNANMELTQVINNAKASFRDDYTQPLLSFYNYSLDVTATDRTDLDSIIYKCTEGVLLHDLRNDWIDDMYLVLGKAYYYRKNFDSSLNCFRYINYAFAPKDDGYDIPIGSNVSNNSGEFSIATHEEQGFFKKLTSRPPVRNQALLWLSKNYIETGQLSSAAGLLEIIRHDPNFPDRLKTSLDETLAYWFYHAKVYDSCAFYLAGSLNNASNRFEQSRWEFLIAQLYQLSGNPEKSLVYYERCIRSTPDPVMEVYAQLNSIDLNQGNKADMLQEKLAALLRLAKKDKYVLHRDIIYYAAARVALQLQDQTLAAKLVEKSLASGAGDIQQKNRSFLLLADIDYDLHAYRHSYNYYDSIQTDQLDKSTDKDRVDARKTALKIVADNLKIIESQDSLQTLAAMPEAQRDAFLKKIAKQQMKLHGSATSSGDEINFNPAIGAQNSGTLFPTAATGNATSQTSGDWYFNNSALKSSGFTEFLQKWGNRPNVDNWQRKEAISNLSGTLPGASNGNEQNNPDSAALSGNQPVTDYSSRSSVFRELSKNIPLTPGKLESSNDSIADALFGNGRVFQDQLEDYPAALACYNELNRRFPKNPHTEQTLFNQYYCNIKTGNKSAADSSRTALENEFGNGKLAAQLSSQHINSPEEVVDPATIAYEHIYNLFIAGNFDQAKAEKAVADSLYGTTHWTPQLLFIESVYYISKRQDSAAINRLKNLIAQFPLSPLAERAKTMIDVLKRRKEIEAYLTSLQIKRDVEEAGPVVTLESTAPTIAQKPLAKADSIVTRQEVRPSMLKPDTVAKAPVSLKSFSFKADDPHYVLIVLDSVDPVFASEAGNAFNRYNMQNYYAQKMEVSSVKLNGRYNLVLIGPFPNALGAINYVDRTKPITASRILPWLTGNKFSFSIISQSNIDLLKNNQDLDGYKKVLHLALPNEF